ncbi:hypothetical protein [Nocardia sp. NPDC048505]|uniref:hypothetical protein n=1 Tax=unclassified Nocardia TaxID=2637762 RepID=UPI0033E43A30
MAVRAPDKRIESWSVTTRIAEANRWLVTLTDPAGVEWTAVGEDVFEGFAEARKPLESSGFRFLVVGARPEYWPTGMSGDMGGGFDLWARYRCGFRNVFRTAIAIITRERGYRYIFAPAPARKVTTAERQLAYRERWLAGGP